jgi:probable F420-dependent oxidoreductase
MSASVAGAAPGSSPSPEAPFRFAVASPGAETRREWTDLARRAESLGYDLLLVNDHLHQPLAPLPALVSAAEATSTLRVGTYVLCQDLRNPVVLANELATVDLLSEGRLEIGLGAGWLDSDYATSGIERGSPSVQVERFAEVLSLVHRLLTEPTVTFSGRHFTATEATCRPSPVQRPRPPLLVGGTSRPVLELAAREADVVSLNPVVGPGGRLKASAPAEVDERIGWVRRAAGSRWPQLRIDLVVWACIVTPRPEKVVEALAAALGVTPAQLLEMPAVLAGPVEQVAEQVISRRRRWGASTVTVPAEAMEAFAPVVERLRSADLAGAAVAAEQSEA